jgi:hypothetical protein
MEGGVAKNGSMEYGGREKMPDPCMALETE